MTLRALFAPLLSGLLAIAAGSASGQVEPETLPWSDPPADAAYVRAAKVAELGRQIFFDVGLSASRVQSCATCHSPSAAFGPTNARSVQRGGRTLALAGTRATPSLTYLSAAPPFTEHFFESEDEGDESVDQGPAGGRTWDGRADRARDQARIPLLAPNEMANVDEAAVVSRAAAAPYAARLRELYGDQIFADRARVLLVLGEALEAFMETPELFSPYSSKYDAYLRGQASLTRREKRGLSAFEDPSKGNCARCHKNQLTPAHALPEFTDFGFVAIGVPRNDAIPANRQPAYFDLGACGPLRKDLANHPEYCGMFKAPTLRNVAKRQSFYHNGIFHSLNQAVSFYATRDTNPERWYPKALDGTPQKFNDLPARYLQNIDVEAPFNRKRGERPALSERDVADIVAFLRTLTDGYSSPAHRTLRGSLTVENEAVAAAPNVRRPSGTRPQTRRSMWPPSGPPGAGLAAR